MYALNSSFRARLIPSGVSICQIFMPNSRMSSRCHQIWTNVLLTTTMCLR